MIKTSVSNESKNPPERDIALRTMLYLNSKLEKQLRTLHRAGKKASLAAQQAQRIIAKLEAGRFSSMETGAITKHGEQRIKGCVKYDLGSGYRLVTIKQDGDLYILYVGSHDDCHRWIENNRELPFADIRRRSQCVSIEPLETNKHNPGTRNEHLNREEADDPGGPEDSLEELEDHQLRILFSGLIQSVQNNFCSS